MQVKIQSYENSSLQRTLLKVQGQSVLVDPSAVNPNRMTATVKRLGRSRKPGTVQAWIPEASSHVDVVLADLVLETGADYEHAVWALT
jgi:hypothetical protein